MNSAYQQIPLLINKTDYFAFFPLAFLRNHINLLLVTLKKQHYEQNRIN